MPGIPRSARDGVSAWITPAVHGEDRLRHRFSVDIPELRVLAAVTLSAARAGGPARVQWWPDLDIGQPGGADRHRFSVTFRLNLLKDNAPPFPVRRAREGSRSAGRHRFSMGRRGILRG